MPTSEQQKHLIVVLGMHRSGTSLITRGLQVLGVSLGDRLLPVAGDNPRGFWEDLEVNALNIALLQALGHDWHTFTPVLPEELAAPGVKAFKLRAVEILRDRFAASDCFGLKDPRIARLFPFWEDVFTHLAVRVGYLIVSRNPLSVARSLAKRNGFDLERGYYLWREHMLGSLVGTRNRDRIVTDYDRFLEDPPRELKRIARGLGLHFNPDDPRLSDFLTRFLDHSLRHNHHRAEDLAMDNSVPTSVAMLYQALCRLSLQDAPAEDAAIAFTIERVRAGHQEAYPALRYMENCDKKITAFTQQVAQLNHDLAEHQATIMSLQNQVSQLNRQLGTIYSSGSWRTAHVLSKILFGFKRPFAWLRPSKADPV
jgi:hypothetical protein